MNEVWLIAVEHGAYEDYQWDVDEAFATREDAESRIRDDFGGRLSEERSPDASGWDLDRDELRRRFGDYRRPMDDGETYEIVPRSPDAPDWYYGNLGEPIVCNLFRMEVNGASAA